MKNIVWHKNENQNDEEGSDTHEEKNKMEIDWRVFCVQM